MLPTHNDTGRLFVPLATGPFNWFKDGAKKWELRKYGRQYTERHVRVGRPVELRCGYNSGESLWGIVAEVQRAPSIREFFRSVPYEVTIPVASSEDEAVNLAGAILGIGLDESPVLGFRIELTR